jgi:hypothetical protein
MTAVAGPAAASTRAARHKFFFLGSCVVASHLLQHARARQHVKQFDPSKCNSHGDDSCYLVLLQGCCNCCQAVQGRRQRCTTQGWLLLLLLVLQLLMLLMECW